MATRTSNSCGEKAKHEKVSSTRTKKGRSTTVEAKTDTTTTLAVTCYQ